MQNTNGFFDLQTADRHIKGLFFGLTWTGKTTDCLSAPGDVVVTPYERVPANMAARFPNARGYWPPGVPRTDLIAAWIKGLTRAMSGELGAEWYVADGYNVVEDELRKKFPDPRSLELKDRAQAYDRINEAIKRELLHPLMNDSQLACNVLVTAKETNQWATDEIGKTNLKQGVTDFRPLGCKYLEHAFDFSIRKMYDPAAKIRWAVVRKTRFPDVLPSGYENKFIFTWDRFTPILTGQVTPEAGDTDVVSTDTLINLHGRAGSPDEKLGRWLQNNGFMTEGKINHENRLKAKDVLQKLVAEREGNSTTLAQAS